MAESTFKGFLLGDRDQFLKDEEKASIFLLNGGCDYLKNNDNSNKLVKKIQQWPTLMNITEEERKEAKEFLASPSGEIPRIIWNDVERAFAAKHNQVFLAKFSDKCRIKWDDYAQSMTYVAGTLLLALDEVDTFCILCRLNSGDKYLPGHWKHEATGYATDSFVSWKFLSDEKHGVSEIPKHLSTYLIRPNSLFQKYMQGLGLHLFPLECAVEYIEKFLSQGVIFLWHFHIALFKWLKAPLLKLERIDLILALLRLESSQLESHGLSYSTAQFLELIEEASKMTFLDEGIDIPALRKEVYEGEVRPLLEAAKVEPDEDECDDCLICKEGLPEFWCESCVKYICEDCNEEVCAPEGHDFISMDDMEDDDIDEKWERAREEMKKVKGLANGMAGLSLN